MANGALLSPFKIIGICISVTLAINGIFMVLYKDQADEIAALRVDLDRKTDQRYRQSDATRDFRLVEFRFERNERNIDKCLEHLEQQK